MNIILLLKGPIIGLSIAAPVGPIGVLCIQRTLNKGRKVGLVSGMGAATADAFYGGVAAFGLTLISDFLLGYQFWIKLIGGVFLLYLGIRTIISKPPERAADIEESKTLNAYISTLFLTITNPMTIMSFIGIFAGIGVVSSNITYISSALLVLGVFLGSALWWLILSTVVSLLRKKVNNDVLKWVNRLSGLIILTFGIISLWSLF